MNDPKILAIITDEIMAVLPHLDREQITPDTKMSDLGADSLDRSEVVQQSMRKLGLRLKPTDLAKVENIGGLADRLSAALQAA